jgi:Peptidase M50B-like
MANNSFVKIFAVFLVYFMIRYMGGQLGSTLLYPITLLVTFLHEFGHAFGAVISGGSVKSLTVNTDGSGVTHTMGGSPAITLMGGYIGSAIFGNLLFYIGARISEYHRITLQFLAGVMVFAGVFWFQNMQSTVILFIFATVLYFIATRSNWHGAALMFFGIASVVYIIQDFNVGPSSDLAQFERVVGIFPANIWKYVWLGIVLSMVWYNLQLILDRRMLGDWWRYRY